MRSNCITNESLECGNCDTDSVLIDGLNIYNHLSTTYHQFPYPKQRLKQMDSCLKN